MEESSFKSRQSQNYDKKGCWWEQQGMRGCAACPLRENWLTWMRSRGRKMDRRCSPKLEPKPMWEDLAVTNPIIRDYSEQ